jgi:hypothetical protein
LYSDEADVTSKPEEDVPGLDDCSHWRDYDFERLRSGTLFCYVGAGLSVAAGLVDWNKLACLIAQFRDQYEQGRLGPPPSVPDVGPENARYIQAFVDERGARRRTILSRLSPDDRAFGRTVLLNLLLRYRLLGERQAIAPYDLALHWLVWRTGCQGVLTTNYDTLLEQAFIPGEHPGPLRTYRYTAAFLRYLLSNPRFVLKLHGDINDIGTMIFDPYSAWKKRRLLGGRRGEDLKRVYTATLKLGHMLYIGSGLRDPTFRELHVACRKRGIDIPHQRIALVPCEEIDVIGEELGADIRFLSDITFLVYPKDSRAEVRDFLEEVVGVSRERPLPEWPEASDIWQQIRSASQQLKKTYTTTKWTGGLDP